MKEEILQVAIGRSIGVTRVEGVKGSEEMEKAS